MNADKEDREAASVNLPPTSFLYTIDQICQLVGMDQTQAMRTIFYYHMRSTGIHSPHLMMARNIAPPNADPEWRVAQREFVRWLKLKGFIIDQMLTVRK